MESYGFDIDKNKDVRSPVLYYVSMDYIQSMKDKGPVSFTSLLKDITWNITRVGNNNTQLLTILVLLFGIY